MFPPPIGSRGDQKRGSKARAGPAAQPNHAALINYTRGITLSTSTKKLILLVLLLLLLLLVAAASDAVATAPVAVFVSFCFWSILQERERPYTPAVEGRG